MVDRAALLEFEINMSEMPLGKLSKSNIQKGNAIKYHMLYILYINLWYANFVYTAPRHINCNHHFFKCLHVAYEQ